MAPSQRVLSTLIGSIYDCALAPSRWDATLNDIARAFGCDKAILSLNDLRHDHILIGKSVGWEPRWLKERENHAPEIHGALSGWVAQGHSDDEPFVASREIPPHLLQTSPYYQNCLRPQRIGDVAHYFLVRTPAHFSELVLMRPEQRGAFGEDEFELGDLLLPHLRRAVMISNVLDVRTIECNRMTEALDALRCAVMLIDGNGAILHANRSAEHMLRSGVALTDSDGILQAKLPSARRELRKAAMLSADNEVTLGKTGVAIRLTESNQEPVLAHVLPLIGSDMRTHLQPAAVAAIFVDARQGEDSNLEAFTATFSLTPAETRIVASLLAGRTLTETARELGVARTTAKTHLDNVFQKTGVSRQVELIQLAFRSTLIN